MASPLYVKDLAASMTSDVLKLISTRFGVDRGAVEGRAGRIRA